MKKLTLILTVFIFIFTSCTSSNTDTNFGLSESHGAYIPARIAVLKCRSWPNEASFLSSNNAQTDIQTKMCSKFDQHVIDGFQNQPYMKGFTPSAVNKLLAKNEKDKLLENFDLIWKSEAGLCETCKNIPSYYKKVMTLKPTWISWLNSFSLSTRDSDAILIPFLAFANESKTDQRGLLVSQNTARIILLLIDTNNAELIWSGQRQAKISNQQLKEGKSNDFPDFPKWNKIDGRLFTNNLWDGFPGRQTF